MIRKSFPVFILAMAIAAISLAPIALLTPVAGCGSTQGSGSSVTTTPGIGSNLASCAKADSPSLTAEIAKLTALIPSGWTTVLATATSDAITIGLSVAGCALEDLVNQHIGTLAVGAGGGSGAMTPEQALQQFIAAHPTFHTSH